MRFQIGTNGLNGAAGKGGVLALPIFSDELEKIGRAHV